MLTKTSQDTVYKIFGGKSNIYKYQSKVVTFSRDSDAAAALLATPNGRGGYWLCLQHAAHVGSKTVESVSIIFPNGHVNMITKFMTVPEGGIGDAVQSSGSGSGGQSGSGGGSGLTGISRSRGWFRL